MLRGVTNFKNDETQAAIYTQAAEESGQHVWVERYCLSDFMYQECWSLWTDEEPFDLSRFWAKVRELEGAKE